METIYIAVIKDDALRALSFSREGEIFDLFQGHTKQDFEEWSNQYIGQYKVISFNYSNIENIARKLYPELESYDLEVLCKILKIENVNRDDIKILSLLFLRLLDTLDIRGLDIKEYINVR